MEFMLVTNLMGMQSVWGVCFVQRAENPGNDDQPVAILTSGARSPQNLLLVRVFVSSLLHKCEKSRGLHPDSPHQQKSKGQA